MGCCGRKFLLCDFPLAAAEEHEEGGIFLAEIMGRVMISAFRNTRESTNRSGAHCVIHSCYDQRPAAPTCGDEQRGSLGNHTLVAFLHFVSEEHFALIGRGAPGLV